MRSTKIPNDDRGRQHARAVRTIERARLADRDLGDDPPSRIRPDPEHWHHAEALPPVVAEVHQPDPAPDRQVEPPQRLGHPQRVIQVQAQEDGRGQGEIRRFPKIVC